MLGAAAIGRARPRSLMPVAQRLVDDAVRNQFLDMSDPLVAGPFELLQRQVLRTIGRVKLLRALACIPLRREVRQDAANLVAVHAVGTLVGPGIVRKGHRAVRHDGRHDLGKLAYLIVVLGHSDVEGLVPHEVCGRAENREKGARNVFDVYDWPPRGAVGLHVDAPGRQRPGNEIVQHEIESDARRYAIGGGAAQERRAERIVRQLGQRQLGADLGFAVRCDRVEGAGLVDHGLAGGAVVRARRGEDEPLHAGRLRRARYAHRALEVDVVSCFGAEIPERVVRQRRQVQHRVKSQEVRHFHVADVLQDRRHILDFATGGEGATLVEVAVEAGNLVAGTRQHRGQHRPDVAPVTRYQYAHFVFTPPGIPIIACSGQQCRRRARAVAPSLNDD